MAIVVPDNIVHATATRTGCQPAKCALLLEDMLRAYENLGRNPEMKLAGVQLVGPIERAESVNNPDVMGGVCAQFELLQGGGTMIVFINLNRHVTRTIYCGPNGAVEITRVTMNHHEITTTIGRGKAQQIRTMLYELHVHAVKTVERASSKQLATSTK